jgi:hypothetical protein
MFGCGGGQEVTSASLAAARRQWQQANVRDYELEWKSSGARAGHYFVTVRDGKVVEIDQLQPDGTRTQARPGDASYYGVEGLFRTIEADVEHCIDLVRNGPDRGKQIFVRFWPDPRYGYPARYRRDVTGSLRSLAIDVVRFAPKER